jgi:hypothetical protein
MSEINFDDMFDEADKVQEFQFLGVSDCLLSFAEWAVCSKAGEALKFEASFLVKECATDEHPVGTIVSTRFKPYDGKYDSHKAREAKRMMDMVKALFDISDKGKASDYCKKMLDVSQPARGILIRSGGYLGKQQMEDVNGVMVPATYKEGGRKGKVKPRWPNISFNHVEGQTKEGRVAERAIIEKIQKYRPAAASAPETPPQESAPKGNDDLAASLGI